MRQGISLTSTGDLLPLHCTDLPSTPNYSPDIVSPYYPNCSQGPRLLDDFLMGAGLHATLKQERTSKAIEYFGFWSERASSKVINEVTGFATIHAMLIVKGFPY